MYLSIIFLPLLSFLVSILGGRYLGSLYSSMITTGSLALAVVISVILLIDVVISRKTIYINFDVPWFEIDSLVVEWCFFLILRLLSCYLL